jgi:hypothetical protein
MKAPLPKPRGSALLLTLGLLVLLTVLLTGLFFSARVERNSAESYLRANQARWLAVEATETAKARITGLIRSGTARFLTQPGALHLRDDHGALQSVPLFTKAENGDPVDLNRAPGGLENHPIAPDGPSMALTWVYVRKNGDTESGPAPAYDPENPLIGRYAWWVDDASARLNINTARGRVGNTAPPHSPSQVELSGLAGVSQEDIAALASGRQKGWFVTVAEAVREAPGLQVPLQQAAFSLTPYNHTPAYNCFGEPRIVLTTRKEVADRHPGHPYLDTTKMAETVALITGYLTRTDWPVAPGHSFAEKYWAGHPERAAQLAYNIIDYVRSKESANPVVVPSRVTPPAEQFLGLTRSPLVTEIGVWVAESPQDGFYEARTMVELYLPPQYGLEEIDLTKLGLWVSIQPDWGTNSFAEALIKTEESSTGATLKAGEYAVITRVASLKESAVNPTRPTQLTMRIALSLGVNKDRLQVCPLTYAPDPGGLDDKKNPTLLDYPVDPAGTPPDRIRTFEVADPRVNQGLHDWQLRDSGNSLGAPNANSGLGAAPADPGAGQDTDENGHLTAAGLAMPAPAFSPKNPLGQVESVSELGVIHTGVDGGLQGKGIPWRTLRLQKAPPGTLLPDWVLLDLFLAPRPAAAPFPEAPHPLTSGGRININSTLLPFENIQRKAPLRALFLNIPAWNAALGADAAAAAVAEFQKSTPWGSPGLYDLAGEILEVPGLADDGEAGEKRLAGYIDHVTTHSNVFLIYALAQSVVQSREGKIRPVAECLTETLFERIPGNPPTFRTRTLRNLQP